MGSSSAPGTSTVSASAPAARDRGAGAGEERVGDVAVEGRHHHEEPGRALEARRGKGVVAFHAQPSVAGIGRVPAMVRP